MILHIFNPEHDIALASGLTAFTAPHAARQLRHDMGWLPALWAEEGDAVLVDDASFAVDACRRFLKTARLRGAVVNPDAVTWVEWDRAGRLPIDAIEPWGWDRALRGCLQRHGCAEALLPGDGQLDDVRCLSNRSVASELLPLLRLPGTVGEAFVCHDESEVQELLQRYGQLVLKAPWSSSGRGLRFIDADRNTLTVQAGWMKNVLAAQGSLMAEPYYNKVRDFGMEFVARADGKVDYLGLSLFHTKNGAYTGNVLATEEAKRQELSTLVPLSLLDEVSALICHHAARLFGGRYTGPFGVDMMLCTSPLSATLHPCVELNLRRTMGHVALALGRLCNPAQDDEVRRVMRLELSDHYLLKLNKL